MRFLKLLLVFFFNKVLVQTPNSKFLTLIVIEYEDNNFKTLSKGKIINYSSLENYINFNLAMFNFKSEDYKTLNINNIIFKYIELPKNNEAYKSGIILDQKMNRRSLVK